MRSLVLHIDGVLRGDARTLDRLPTDGGMIRHGIIAFVALAIYGGCMGSFGLWSADAEAVQWLQTLYSALKVPMMLGATFLICLPSFFVFNALAGLAPDFRESLRALSATQSGLALVLASLSPMTLLWYATSDLYLVGVLVNTLMFAVATLSAQRLIVRYYQPLIRRNPRHRLMLGIWVTLYIFVGTQMGWVLRPFIGNPNGPVHFLREDGWGNAYLAIVKIIESALHL